MIIRMPKVIYFGIGVCSTTANKYSIRIFGWSRAYKSMAFIICTNSLLEITFGRMVLD